MVIEASNDTSIPLPANTSIIQSKCSLVSTNVKPPTKLRDNH